MRTYSELITLPTFEERYKYLRLQGEIGNETFGAERYLNQRFYRSREWKHIRNFVITRDMGCDLGVEDREIPKGVKIIIHHMNPITVDDMSDNIQLLLDPDYLITTMEKTHNAIHFSDESILYSSEPVIRRPGDTCPWR